uniref:ATP synthase F(0) complex subunit f, mitochondrial n=3 Tax=Canis lupus TaxID=9612 RepID=A0A8C0MMN5_CANLF
MASSSSVPVKEKKLMEVKLGELPGWILMRDFIPKGIVGAFKKVTGGYYWYYNKYINVKKGGVPGISVVLAAYVLFNYCPSYKELKHERLHKYHGRVPSVEARLAFLTMTFAWHP